MTPLLPKGMDKSSSPQVSCFTVYFIECDRQKLFPCPYLTVYIVYVLF